MTITRHPKVKAPYSAPCATVITPPPTSKLQQLEMLLQRPEGAAIADMISATSWQAHSVRGALAGALKRRGHSILSDKVEGVRHYRIGGA